MTSSWKITVLIFLSLSPGFHCHREEKGNIYESTKKLANDIYHSDYFCFGWKTAAVATGALVAMPAAVGALGFGAAGVTAGSLAAAYQATLGGTILGGSTFAALQSVGAVGLGATAKAAVVTGSGAAVAYFFGTSCGDGQTAGEDGKCSR